MDSNKEVDDATEPSGYSGSRQGQTTRMIKSLPKLPDGVCLFNILDSTITEKGGVTVFDQIGTWCEEESVRKDSKKKKIMDADLEGGQIQRKFLCNGKTISGEKCHSEKIVGFSRGNIKSRKFRTIKYCRKHICKEFIAKKKQLENQSETVSVPKGKTSTSISVRKPSEKIKTVKELTFPCTLCERRFQYERGLKRHVLQKHERSHHQLREENFSHQINPSDKSETDLNDSSSDLGDLPSSPLPSPSRPESGRYTETDTETENSDKLEGYYDSLVGASRKDLDDEIRNMRTKNDRDIVHEKRNSEGRVVQTKSSAYFHGSAQAIVKNIVTHQEYKEEIKCKDKNDQQQLQIKKQTRLFEQVIVAKGQSDAIHKYLDAATECEQSCVYLQRRFRLHKQQVLLGLEGIAKSTLARTQLINFVTGHLKLLKLHDQHYGKFIAFLRKSFLWRDV